MKALYSDEYVRTEAYSQIAFMDLRARDNAYEVVDTMVCTGSQTTRGV